MILKNFQHHIVYILPLPPRHPPRLFPIHSIHFQPKLSILDTVSVFFLDN